ncbi:MAG: hypothetical protein WC812_01015 [Candidatus Pacearchaeota archaeon]|jgi:hypothetical protein
MVRERDKRNLIIAILAIVVIVLVLVLLYFFVVKPSINNYIITKQIEAQSYIFADMVNQLQTKGYYQVTLGNSTIVLVPPQAS